MYVPSCILCVTRRNSTQTTEKSAIRKVSSQGTYESTMYELAET